MQPQPDVFPWDQHKASHQNRNGKQDHGHDLIALLDLLKIAQALLLLFRLGQRFFFDFPPCAAPVCGYPFFSAAASFCVPPFSMFSSSGLTGL